MACSVLFTIVLECSNVVVPGTVILVFIEIFMLPLPSPSPLLTQCERCLEDYVGLMVGLTLQGLPAMEDLYCLGACCSRWRTLDIPGTHLPYSKIQLLMWSCFLYEKSLLIQEQLCIHCVLKTEGQVITYSKVTRLCHSKEVYRNV